MSSRSDITVALILTPSFETLKDLIERMPVWAVDVPEHRSPFSIPKERAYQDWLTLYKTHSVSLEDECINQIGSIEEHFPGMSHVLLVGLKQSPKLEKDLRDIGYVLVRHGIELVAYKQPN